MINPNQIIPFYPALSLVDQRGVYNYMSSPTIYGLIRALVERTGGPYLEIGSYRGQSLLAAGQGTNYTCLGIDNFTGTGYRANNRAILLEQIAPHGNIDLMEADYREAFTALRKAKKKFAVIFADGPHDYEGTAGQLKGAHSLLKKGGYLIIDDLNEPAVTDALTDFLKKRRYDILFEQRTAIRQHPTWWNGIMVMQKR